MIKRSKTINRCQISKKKDLTKILSLGYLPPVNNYYSINSNKNEGAPVGKKMFSQLRESSGGIDPAKMTENSRRI